jgi:hypothetical protein
VEVDFDGSGNITGARMRGEGQSSFHSADVNGNYVVGAVDTPEEGLWIEAEWDGLSTTQTAEVSVRQGITGRVTGTVDHMLNSQEGLISTARSSINDTLSDLQERLDEAEKRLSLKRERLVQRFARLEEQLASMQGFQQVANSMTSMFGM